MNLLIFLRTIAVAVAIVCTLLSLIATVPFPDRLRKIAKFAALGALGAQVAHELDAVVARRAPWTKLLLPVLGLSIAVRTFHAGSLPLGAVAFLALADAALLAFAGLVVMRALRRDPGAYTEDVIERELDRFTPGPFNRFMAAELVVIASAVRYVFGGFRRPLPDGFSYVKRWSSLPLFVAIPILTLPEMAVLDFALWHASWYWRFANDALHLYAMLWCFGLVATARTRPHRCDAQRVRLRFGCLRKLDLERSNIAAASVHAAIADSRAHRRALRRQGDAFSMALSGAPAVELTLREPVEVRSLLGRSRSVRRVFVAVDEPAAFAAALAA
ncbi:MAG: hypothetical protein NVS3B7_13980 [Candidatus Elarobacter sp.]